jgi:hypothetical protein
MSFDPHTLLAARPAPAEDHGIRPDPDVYAASAWDRLTEPLQLMVASAALRRAAASIAFQAETLAREMESGGLEDRGGPDALRLLAAVVRVTSEDGLADSLAA